MIAFIKGKIIDVEDNCVIVESGNIGYHIFMPMSAIEEALSVGVNIRIHTYLSVREDAMQLYGFLTRDDLKLFKQLLGVNGVGPKAALGILSALSADDLRFAVLSEDIAAISKAPGIGKKTAQKLILELKDKISLEEAFEQKLSGNQKIAASLEESQKGEAVQALVALGYSNADALKAVNQVEDSGQMDTESILKAALKRLL